MKVKSYFLLLLFPSVLSANTTEPTIESNQLNADKAFTTRVWTADYLGQYRIPSLSETKHKILLAFIEKRDRQGDQSGNDLALKRSLDEGKTWGSEQLIYAQGNDSINNPTVVVADNNLITIMFNVIPKGYSLFSNLPKGSTIIKVKVMYSSDNGASWTDPIDITDKVVAPDSYLVNVGPGNGVAIANGQFAGRVVMPSYAKYSPGRDISKTYALSIYNDRISEFMVNPGQNLTQQQALELSEFWEIGNTNSRSLANEIAITEYGFNGKLYYLARQYQDKSAGGTTYDSSFNGGFDWQARNKQMSTFPFRTQSGLAKFESADALTNTYVMTTPVGPWRFSKGRTDGRIVATKHNVFDNLSWVGSRYRIITDRFFSNSSATKIFSQYSPQRVGVLYEGNVSKTENKVDFINFSSIDLNYVRSGKSYRRP
ncbi:hypothetical protein NFHSH190041_31640 [Shewanella sp. NFH-SH190041]|uniref:exo-alpha-sialidase n=1 Tax=Shewanella sp. NFH-SH190041 TaxID=2950245 RepID=UPI0021C32A9E|nr:sialidase family protein [Shewanella sp. NFH-SH190041]BDM65712.1 hypothetical protein NFHSH190041_31640 [Shewanella sp. NFH-SH190041]